MENFIREPYRLINNKLKFQIISWYAKDEQACLDDEDSELIYKIYIFGSTLESKNVCLCVKGFTPFFYILIPSKLQSKWQDCHSDIIERHLEYKFKLGFRKLELVEKINIYGYSNNLKQKYLKLVFNNETSFKRAKYLFRPTVRGSGEVDKSKFPKFTKLGGEPLEFKIFEHNIEPYIRFCHRQKIEMAGWIEIDKKHLFNPEEQLSSCQIEYETKWFNVYPSTNNKNASLVIASFDLECVPEDRRTFPDPNKPNDVVLQIGTTFYNTGTKNSVKHVITIGSAKEEFTCNPVEDTIIDVCKNESEVIKGWAKLMSKISPDIITGYNIYNFDWSYLYTRSKIIGCEYYLQKLSKLKHVESNFQKDRLSSGAYGDNFLNYLNIPGMINIDMYFTIKREHKLESYKLDAVSSHFLKDNKVDLEPEELFRKVDGSAQDIADISRYCAQDTFLVIKLIQRLRTISNSISMANKTKIPLLFVETKGQQIKVFSQILNKTLTTDYVVPTVNYGEANEESFTGATVLDAKPGAYFIPISGLDFASLYPSVMIAYNLCYSTLITNKDLVPENTKTRVVKWKDNDDNDCQAEFIQEQKGILPELLEELWKERKVVKKQMKNEKDPDVYDVLNGVQLAIKVSMNSIYGFTGATYGKLSEKKIASAVTALGRESIQQAKYYAELWYDCDVKYGDSVTGYTPVYIKQNEVFHIIEIQDIENLLVNPLWKQCSNVETKEYLNTEPLDIYTWTDFGWTKLKRVIRHKLHPSKKIIRILTHTGLVDVTDDHSLLLEDGTEISPKNVKIGDKLKHAKLPFVENESNITPEEAEIYGFFFGDGSCGFYHCLSGNKASWGLNNSNYELLEYYKKLCEKVYPDLKWVILDTLNSSGVYKLVPNSTKYGITTTFIKEYRTKTYNNNSKIIPLDIINSNVVIREAFLKGLYDADGDKDKNGYIRIDQKNHISCAQINWLFETLYFNTSLNTRTDKPDIVRMSATTNKQRKDLTTIKKLEEIEYSGYVYDLTTENNHFSAGVGDIVVHNTDSIYVEFKTDNKGKDHFDKVFEISEEAAQRISATFPKPMELEFEKVMYPFLIMSKKRYACVIWTEKEKYDYIDYKGLQVKRRDSCQYVRNNGEKLFEQLLLNDIFEFKFDNSNENIKTVTQSAQECILKLLRGQVPMKELILTRALKGEYKNENVPHVALCRKMKERDPNNVPQIGDRVKYVFVDTGKDSKLQADFVEDPNFVIKHGLQLYYYYYYEHQLKSMIETIFSVLPVDITDVLSISKEFKPVIQKWASKPAKELALNNGFTLEDFPELLKIKKDDVLKLIKDRT